MDKLGLNQNKIEDISVLEKVDFKELRELYLEWNKISDISVFEKVHFDRLENLGLHFNKIDLISNALLISYLDNKIKNFSFTEQHLKI